MHLLDAKPSAKDPVDKQGILQEAGEGKLDEDMHVYTVKYLMK